MNEPGAGEIQSPQPRPGMIDRVKGALRGAVRAFEIDTKPVPLDQITAGKVATIINGQIRNPLREMAGQSPFANGFDMAIVLGALNYPGMWAGEDNESLYRRHPEAYEKTQFALAELQKRGVLEVLRDPDTQAIVRYRVQNPLKLEEIASNAKPTTK